MYVLQYHGGLSPRRRSTREGCAREVLCSFNIFDVFFSRPKRTSMTEHDSKVTTNRRGPVSLKFFLSHETAILGLVTTSFRAKRRIQRLRNSGFLAGITKFMFFPPFCSAGKLHSPHVEAGSLQSKPPPVPQVSIVSVLHVQSQVFPSKYPHVSTSAEQRGQRRSDRSTQGVAHNGQQHRNKPRVSNSGYCRRVRFWGIPISPPLTATAVHVVKRQSL